MWRMLFLILVVVGALAMVLVTILGLGVAKVAMVQDDGSADRPNQAAPATAPASGPVSAAPGDTGGTDATIDRAGELPPVEADAPPVVANVAKPENYVPGTIVLRGAVANLKGKLLRKNPPHGDLTSWTRPEEYASWVFTPPQGKYHVFVTHANGAGSGGAFGFTFSISKQAEFVLQSRVGPTGGWDTFKTTYAGALELNEKRTTLVMRPAGDLEGPLMQLRQIELVPFEPLPSPDGPELALEIMGLTIVEADTGKPLGLLTNLMALDLASMPAFSLRAETAGRVQSVQFSLDKQQVHTESERPFSIAGDAGDTYTPWKPEPGRYSLVVTPFPEPGGGGKAGHKRTYYIRIASSAPIVLPVKDAKLNGGSIRFVDGDVPTIGSWKQEQDWVEWTVDVAVKGDFDVELLYSCGRGNGGEFVLKAGSAKLTETISSTDGWDSYNRRMIGTVKLSSGKTKLAIKPSDLDDGKMLMNLREVRLVPVIEADED